MPNEVRFALYALKKNIQSSAELRTSFIMNILGMAINNSAFIILWVFFVKSVGIINGWTASDIIGLLGFGALAFGIVFTVGAGIRKLPDYTASGAFDRFMLSPKNLLSRIATSSFNASAVGDIVFGVVCLVVYAVLIQATLYQILLILFLILLTTIVYFAAAISIYSTSFLFVDANAVSNGLFELFITPSLFHGGAFQGVLRFIFIFIIPSLLVGALPVEAIKAFSLEKLGLISLLAFLWLFLSIKFFHWAVKKYESSNFMTFGN